MIVTLLALANCSNRHEYEVSKYLTPDQRQSILDQTIRYMYYDEGIPAALRFDTTYDAKYERVARDFYFARYHFAAPGEKHTFLVVRRYPGEKYRGVGGTLEVDANDHILRFEEKFVTPLATHDDVLERAGFLFIQLVETGEVDPKYYKMKSYIEWPDEHTMYDTLRHEWRRSR